MTTLLLPPDDVARIRALKSLTYTLSVMMLLDRNYPGRAFRPEEVALIAGLDARTITKQLKDLSVLDRVILSGSGYVLTQGGRGLFLAPTPNLPTPQEDRALGNATPKGGTVEALALSRGEIHALSPEPVQAHQDQALQTLDLISETEEDPPIEIISDSDAHTVRAPLVVEVNTFTLLSRNDSSTTYLDAQLARKLTVAQVFSKSRILFGESVLVRKDITASYALSVFAHVCSQKDSFHFPARVAFAMMRDNKDPREDFVKDPWKHLPSDFLEALNVVRYQCSACTSHDLFSTSKALEEHVKAVHPPQIVCDECGEKFSSESDFDKHWDEKHVETEIIRDASVDEPCLNNVRTTPAHAWQAVLGQLKMEIHRAPFETWVRDTKAVRFDGATLFIGTRNSYTAQWLESRLQSTVERLLVGIMNQSVDVMFVVAEFTKRRRGE